MMLEFARLAEFAPPCGTAALSPLRFDQAPDGSWPIRVTIRLAGRRYRAEQHADSIGRSLRLLAKPTGCARCHGRVALLLFPEGAAAAGPQARAHAAAPAGSRKGAQFRSAPVAR
ncbi:MAG: hypothetical protein BGO92_02325 [Magnetospirillum sp. 64-120]|nr:MAG: hypothetical protein BGO92_02325 [Magnetospirillum sp. 64-120]